MSEQAVILDIELEESGGTSSEQSELAELDLALEDVLEEHPDLEYDGYDIGDDTVNFFLYGPDADILFSVVKSVILRSPLKNKTTATVRYGDADDEDAIEKEVKFSELPDE